jgi:hypothetical protein
VELTMSGANEPEGITAVLLQLADIGQKLAALDQRQASDSRHIQEHVAALAATVNDLKGEAASHAEALAALDSLEGRIAALAQQAGDGKAASDGDESRAYEPSAAPRWWKLDGPERDQAIAKLRAWVEQVYRPGYGHLASGLGECWERHPLCLYVLDWLSELWSVLYLRPGRTAGTLAGQAEWHTRLLTAAAEQLGRETKGCRHCAVRYPAADRTGSRP